MAQMNTAQQYKTKGVVEKLGIAAIVAVILLCSIPFIVCARSIWDVAFGILVLVAGAAAVVDGLT